MLMYLQTLTLPELRKFPKVRWIRRICDVSVIIKLPVALVIIIVPRTEWQDEVIYVVEFLIVIGGKSFENTLGVVPVEHANRWEVQQGVVRSEGDLVAVTH